MCQVCGTHSILWTMYLCQVVIFFAIAQTKAWPIDMHPPPWQNNIVFTSPKSLKALIKRQKDRNEHFHLLWSLRYICSLFIWSVSSLGFNAYFSKPKQVHLWITTLLVGLGATEPTLTSREKCLGEGMCGKLSPPGIYLLRWSVGGGV